MNNDVLDITPGAIAAAIGEYCRRHNCSWQPRAALIDMDGTLIDSMRSHAAAWKRMTDREGLSVPQDVSVTGYDNSYLAQTCRVPLTTISHPQEELGALREKLKK